VHRLLRHEVRADLELTHYSYTFYRDPHHAHQYEADRFGGPIGRWLLERETRTYVELVRPAPGERILDVGTGTGKLIAPMAEAGAFVLATDASEAMLRQAAAKPVSGAGSVQLVVMDGHRLAFRDRSFDAVLSSRVLMHVADPRAFIAELCRVSRGRVVLDFPPKSSSNALLPLLLPLKRKVDPDTHPYRVFRLREVAALFEEQGFRVARTHRQLLLPHFVHRRLNRPHLSERLEGLLRAGRLTGLLGAPLTLVAVRR
jgi:ubiquinone/menaquinone biosynthesis C-methylase UbiE